MIKHIKRVGKNSIVFGFGTILTQALGLILIPVYTRVLTPADYGMLSIIMVVQTILLKIYTSPRGAVTRFYFEYKDSKKELKKFIATTLFYSIGIALITSLILSVFGKNLFGLFAKNIPFKYIQFAIWIAFFGTVFPIVLSIYQAREKSLTYSILNITKFLLTVGFIILFVVLLKQGVLGNVRGVLIAGVIMFVIALIILAKYTSLSFDLVKLKELFHYSAPLIPHVISGWIITMIARILLNKYGKLEEVGIYTLGYQCAQIMGVILMSFNFAWTPFFFSTAKELGDKAERIFAKLTSLYMIGILFIALSISIFAKYILMLIATPEYYSAYLVIPVIVLGYVFNGMYFMATTQLNYKKQTKYLPLITGSAALFNFLLNCWMIPKFGIMGAAWTSLFSFAFMFIFSLIISRKVYPIKYEYVKILKLFVLSIVIFYLANYFSLVSITKEIVVRFAVVLLYFPGLYIFKIINLKEIMAVISLIKRNNHN